MSFVHHLYILLFHMFPLVFFSPSPSDNFISPVITIKFPHLSFPCFVSSHVSFQSCTFWLFHHSSLPLNPLYSALCNPFTILLSPFLIFSLFYFMLINFSFISSDLSSSAFCHIQSLHFPFIYILSLNFLFFRSPSVHVFNPRPFRLSFPSSHTLGYYVSPSSVHSFSLIFTCIYIYFFSKHSPFLDFNSSLPLNLL